jgi:uncharacterized membrane protein
MYVALVHAIGVTTVTIVYWYTLVRGGHETSYMTSPLWLDIPLVPQIVVLQVVSVVCLLVWVGLRQQEPATPLLYGVSIGFYAFSTVWPTLANRFLEHPTYTRALAASSPLWGTGICTLLLLRESIEISTRLLMTPMVVLTVVCDALLWTLAALRRVPS